MNKARLTFLLCALNGVVLPAAIAAPLPKAEFNWRAAPSEEQIATLTLRDAILRAFARNPKISEAAAQIHVGEAISTQLKVPGIRRSLCRGRQADLIRPTPPAA